MRYPEISELNLEETRLAIRMGRRALGGDRYDMDRLMALGARERELSGDSAADPAPAEVRPAPARRWRLW